MIKVWSITYIQYLKITVFINLNILIPIVTTDSRSGVFGFEVRTLECSPYGGGGDRND
jgi:hypothetical protein